MRCHLGLHSWRPCGCTPIRPVFARKFGVTAGPGCPYRRCRRCARIELMNRSATR